MALRPVSGFGVQRYVPHLAGIPSIAWSFELALAQYPVSGILFSSIQREPGLQQNVIIANNATSAKVQIEDREGNEGPQLVVSGGVEAGDVLMGGASGAGSLLLNTKASQEAACSRAPATMVPGRKPESRDAGVSRFGEIGSHLEGADTAEGHAGQVERSGMSGKCRNRLTPGRGGYRRGSCGAGGKVRYERKMPEQAHTWQRHRSQTRLGCRLAVQVAANSPKMAHTWWRRASAISPDGPVTAAPNAPYRIRPPVVRDGLAGQYCTENGLVVYVRPILAPGPHAAVAARAGAADSRDAWLVADKCLIMSGMMIRPVWFCRQVKCSFA